MRSQIAPTKEGYVAERVITEYTDEPWPPIPEDAFVLQLWIQTTSGAELWGMTLSRGPFEDLRHLVDTITAAVPYERIQRPMRMRSTVVQTTLF